MLRKARFAFHAVGMRKGGYVCVQLSTQRARVSLTRNGSRQNHV
jgi:hypothetical protein